MNSISFKPPVAYTLIAIITFVFLIDDANAQAGTTYTIRDLGPDNYHNFSLSTKLGNVHTNAKDFIYDCISPELLKNGDLGYLELWHGEVLSIVDKDKFLISLSYHGIFNEVILCVHWPTKDLVNKEKVRLMGPVKIDGTFSYRTVGGSTNKVRVIKFLPEKEAIAFDEVHKPKPETPKGKIVKKGPPKGGYKVREWEDETGKYKINATFVKFERGKVTLKKKDGSETTLPLAKLSNKDIKWVRENR